MDASNQLIIGFILGAVIGSTSYRLKLLTFSGLTATVLLATIIYGFGGWKYTIPMLIFFSLSSLLSKLRKLLRPDVDEFFEKNDARDFAQVLANGGVACAILLWHQFIPLENIYLLYIASICIAASDTWATEIGTIKNTRTYNASNFKIINQGMSGGVSILGSFGAFIGSISISLSALFWVKDSYTFFMSIAVFIGLIGCFYDSLLGSTLQAQYICDSCNKITERKTHCSKSTRFYKGIKWLNNDLVNFVSSLIGVLTLLLILMFYNWLK